MKVPEPRKMPSGKWLIQIMVDGKRTSKSFDTASEARYWAAGIKTKMKEQERSPGRMSVSAAVDRYIESKSAILSPSTILGYKRIKANSMGAISTTPLGDLTREQVQRWINGLAREKSPKTVANAHGLLSAVLAEYRPDMVLRTTLPQKVKSEIQIPSETEIKAIVTASKGTKYELSILLAIWLGLRQSEILGLTWDCVDGDTLHIKQAIVMGENGPVEKGTKSYSGKRDIHIPPYIKDLLDAQPKKGDHIINLSGKAIYSGFSRICEKAGVPHYRFHDLRHVNASAMLALNVPDKYAMKRMGHATNNMLKSVYQHTINEKEQQVNASVDQYFESILE
jgi:integrase